jgi:hypothetical protein
MITHIVFFKLKDQAPAGVERAREVLAGLAGQAPPEVIKCLRAAGASIIAVDYES